MPDARAAMPSMRRRRGAALIIVIAIMTILLAIALTFFTTANVEVKISTNVANSVRASLIEDAAIAIAESQLNQDFLHNTEATSLDHPWRSLFNGAAFVGKPWARFKQAALTENNDGTRQPGLPEFNFAALEKLADGVPYIRFRDGVVEPLFQGSRSKQWLYIPRYQGPSSTSNGNNVLVLYDCVTLCTPEGDDFDTGDPRGTAAWATDYLGRIQNINNQLATAGLFLAYYNGDDTRDCLRDTFTVDGANQLPQVTDEDVPFVTSTIYGAVFDGNGQAVFGGTAQYPEDQTAVYTDVDTDGDGKNDAIWIPIPIDAYFTQDGIDNNLNGWADEQNDNGANDDGADESGDMAYGDSLAYKEGTDTTDKFFNDPDEAIEAAVFVYDGSADGLDNDGDGIADGPSEQPPNNLFLTAPLPGLSFYLDLNSDGIAYDRVPDESIYDSVYQAEINARTPVAAAREIALRESLKPLRVTLPGRIRVLYNGNIVTLGPENVDTIDNDYDLVVNDYSAYCYVGPNTLTGTLRPPFETYFDNDGVFVDTNTADTFNSYLQIANDPALRNIWPWVNLPVGGYYDTWRAVGNWFQPVPLQDQMNADQANGRTFASVQQATGDPFLYERPRRKAFVDINAGTFDLNGDGFAGFTFTPRNIHVYNAATGQDTTVDLNQPGAFDNAIHITHTGEPVCDLAGRAAIHITDEASKININVAGGQTYNDEYPRRLGTPYEDNVVDAGPLASATLGQGTGAFEYDLRMLPGSGSKIAAGLYAGRVGSPGDGKAVYLDIADASQPNALPAVADPALDFTYDVSFPGYGRADDNGDALLLAMNARDDDGDGLMDEGLFLPARYGSDIVPFNTYRASLTRDANEILFGAGGTTPTGLTYNSISSAYGSDAYARNLKDEIDRYREYYNRLGNLEGVDDPGEFQVAAALRNLLAERNGNDDNVAPLLGLVDEPGELSDRVYSDITPDEIAQRAGVTKTFIDHLRKYLTTFSTDRNSIYLTTAKGAKRAISRLDFNYANPQQIAATLLVKGDFTPGTEREITVAGNILPQIGKQGPDANGEYFDTNGYFAGLRQGGRSLRAPDPTGTPASPGLINQPEPGKEGDALTGGMMFVRTSALPGQFQPTTTGPAHEIPSDAFLDALQLAANIVDNRDRDHARSSLTTELTDSRADTAENNAFAAWPQDTDLNNRERIAAADLLPTEDIETYVSSVLGLSPKKLQAVDTWWEGLVYNTNAIDAQGQPKQEERHFSYTAAGHEAIRINELMVRPVRRVEAEMMALDSSYNSTNDEYTIETTPNYFVSNSLDPMDDMAFPGNFDGHNFDPAPGFFPVAGSPGVFKRDPLPDFNMTRQTLLTAIGSSGRFSAATSSWTPDYIDFGFGPDEAKHHSLGDEFAIANNGPETVTVNRPSYTDSAGTIYPPATLDPPDVVQFIIRGANVDPTNPFAPMNGLPPGRYYFTVNTVDSTGAQTIDDSGQLQYSIKYAQSVTVDSAGGATAANLDNDDTIIGELFQIYSTAPNNAAVATYFSDNFRDVGAAAIAGPPSNPNTYREGRVPGWVFLDGTPGGSPSANYFQDGGNTLPAPAVGNPGTHTVTVPPPGSQVALCIAFKRAPGFTGKIAINFFDLSQQPDHEYVELTNTSQEAVDVGNWKLEVGIPDSTNIPSDPHKSVWKIPANTTVAPGGMLLLTFDKFDQYLVNSGGSKLFDHNGIGMAAFDNPPPLPDPLNALVGITVPPIADISSDSASVAYNQMFATNGRFYDPTGSVFERAFDPRFKKLSDDSPLPQAAFDYVDRDGDGLTSYYLASNETLADGEVAYAEPNHRLNSDFNVPQQALYAIDALADDARLENDLIQSTTGADYGLTGPNKPWDRIVQLECVQRRLDSGDASIDVHQFYPKEHIYPAPIGQSITDDDTGSVDDVADVVLRGGYLPDYPEHDGHDNDGDGAYFIANTCQPVAQPPAPALPVNLPFRFFYVAGILDKDMIDNNLNGVIDERGVGFADITDGDDCVNPLDKPGEKLPDITLSEGVDEGNLFQTVISGTGITRLRNYGPGSFEAGLIPAIFLRDRGVQPTAQEYLLYDPAISGQNPASLLENLPNDAKGIPTDFDLSQSTAEQSGLILRLGGLESYTSSTGTVPNFREAYYLGSDLDPPDWKAFAERRWNPGDDVIVSLYDASGGLADRTTYREYDVVNRTVDDVGPCPYFADLNNDGEWQTNEELFSLVQPGTNDIAPNQNLNPSSPLDPDTFPGYPSWWRPNQMGLDFYRSLERKDPDYAGDLFGTSNRWQPTDGNYDDWAESLPFFVALVQTSPNTVTGGGMAPETSGDIRVRFEDPTLTGAVQGFPQDEARMFRHCIWGSPLRMNLASRLLRNPANLPLLFSSNNEGNQDAHFPTGYTDDDYGPNGGFSPIADHSAYGVPTATANRRPFAQFPAYDAVRSYRANSGNAAEQPWLNVLANNDWSLGKAAGADRFSHRDLRPRPDFPEWDFSDPANLGASLSNDEHEIPALLKAGTAMENENLRGMDEPYRTEADLMRVPMPMFRHDMFNLAWIASDPAANFQGEAPFLFSQDPLGLDVDARYFRFPLQLASGVFGANRTDLDPKRMWAETETQPTSDVIFGRDPVAQVREAPLAEAAGAMASNPIVLTVGQADFVPVAPASFEFASNPTAHPLPAGATGFVDLVNWQGTTPPEAWAPVILYAGPSDGATAVYPAYPNGAASGVLFDLHYLFNANYLFPNGTGPSYFTGATRGGTAPVAYGLTPQAQALRWPLEKRVAMYVSANRKVTSTQPMNPDDRADAVFTWDQEDGLENGEYIVYVGTFVPGLAQRVREAEAQVATVEGGGSGLDGLAVGPSQTPLTNDNPNPGDPSAPANVDDAIGALLKAEDTTQTQSWAPHLQMEFITDRIHARGMAPIDPNTTNAPPQCTDFSTAQGLMPPSCWQPGVTYTADRSGLILYAAQAAGAWQPILVRVTDNFLALRVRNVGDSNQWAALTHVVLTPRKRTPGKINVNTANMAEAKPNDGNTRFLFSTLMGLPGIVNDFEKHPSSEEAPVTPPNTTVTANLSPADYLGNGIPVPPAPYDPSVENAADAMDGYPNGNVDERNLRTRDRATQVTSLVQAGRPVHANGRYYAEKGDLARGDRAFGYQAGNEPPTGPLFPLSNNANAEQRFDDTEQRFRRMANEITTRSDVFEIIATVQAGYCLDTNNDGRLNYRSPDEWVTTAETTGRVVYERRTPSDTSDRASN